MMKAISASHSRAARRHQRVEHRLQVECRAADGLEHVADRGLLLKRLAEIVGALLHLVEQPRVLDGDRGLIGKALLQRHFVVGEGRNVVAVDDQRADRLAVEPQRRARHRACAGGANEGQAGPVGDGGIDVVEVGDVDLAVLGDDDAGHVAAADLELGQRHAGADALGAVADPDDF
ncbi:hypothetical protein ABIF64_004409 [Bradyrhizobium japonicum]